MAQPHGRHRSWCITVNNWTEADYKLSLLVPYRYIIIGRERGELGIPHLQIYLECKNPISLKSLKEYFPRGHLEVREGTQQQARQYCMKEHYHEYGNFVIQGKRNDLTIAMELLDEGLSVGEGLRSGRITTIGTLTAYEKLQKYHVIHRPRPRVFWIYGPGGSGKTAKAYSLCCSNVFKVDLFEKGWYEGYDQHRSIIIDDLDIDSDDKEIFKALLALFDRYPLRVNVKNSSVSIAAEVIVVTSQKPPWKIWAPMDGVTMERIEEYPTVTQIDNNVELRQIMRRITDIIYLSGENKKLNYPTFTKE